MNEFDNEALDEETPVVHLELEDGTEVDCAVICIFGVKDKDYIALVSIDDLEEEEGEGELLLYRYEELEDDEIQLDNIEDDEEYQEVAEAFDEILESEDAGEID